MLHVAGIDTAMLSIARMTHVAKDVLDEGRALFATGKVVDLDEGFQVPMAPSSTDVALVDSFYACVICATKDNDTICAHAVAVLLHEMLKKHASGVSEASATVPTHIDPDDIVLIEGRPHPKYQGLLKAARARGLVSLEALFTLNADTLSIAVATALFANGDKYVESADATPTNVGSRVSRHFRRMALTRAKSRALRDALGIGDASFEELGGEDSDALKPPAVPSMEKASPASASSVHLGPQAQTPFLADGLVQDEYDGKPYWKVMSSTLPKQFQQYGIPLRSDVARASGVDFLVPTDIAGWEVHWTLENINGKLRPRVTQLIDPETEERPF